MSVMVPRIAGAGRSVRSRFFDVYRHGGSEIAMVDFVQRSTSALAGIVGGACERDSG